ncbi:MAG TPA: hypothetical protein PLQ67_00280 [Burkholderiaceae bacterium]|nr:hypothetical protein [Burkholderiaceae bacterium]
MTSHRFLTRWLAMLAVWLLPVHVLSAAVMPLAGPTGHAHAPAAVETAHLQDAGLHEQAHEGGCAHEPSAAATAMGTHEHVCPHAAMALACAAFAYRHALQAPQAAIDSHPTPMHSVSLEVLTPPPRHR